MSRAREVRGGPMDFRMDSFGGALADLPRNSSPAAVLRHLGEHPRCSTFDISGQLATTISRLTEAGRIEWDHSEGYPWLRAVVLPLPPDSVIRDVTGGGS